MKAYLGDRGIIHELMAPYNPEQNSIAERFNRTLMKSVRTMIHTAGIPDKLWAELALTATYLHNRLPSRTNPNNASPHELLFSMKSSINHLRIIWADAFM